MHRCLFFCLLPALACLAASCRERLELEPGALAPPIEEGQQLRAAWFADSLQGFAVGGRRFESDLILSTEDGGQRWERLQPDAPLGKMIFDLRMSSPLEGFASALDGKLLRTRDGGLSWQLLQLPYWLPMHAVVQVSDSLILAAGGVGYDQGVICRSANGGLNWACDTFAFELRDLFFTGPLTGYACGYGTILKTEDGGRNWAFTPARNEFFVSLHFPSAQRGYAAGRTGSILRTQDAGKSWESLRDGNLPTTKSEFYNHVIFVSENVGYIAGDRGLLLKTSDGGRRWKRLLMPTKADFHHLFLLREGRGFLSASDGRLWEFRE
jgi:photosystem II stability/assembly factor-like uncharacterized protein